jgi:hypothetical protein
MRRENGSQLSLDVNCMRKPSAIIDWSMSSPLQSRAIKLPWASDIESERDECSCVKKRSLYWRSVCHLTADKLRRMTRRIIPEPGDAII